MHPSDLVAQEGRRHRRQFSNEYKAEVVASCQQRGVSVAAVARAHDLHPNLLRKWVQEYERFEPQSMKPRPPSAVTWPHNSYRCGLPSLKRRMLRPRLSKTSR